MTQPHTGPGLKHPGDAQTGQVRNKMSPLIDTDHDHKPPPTPSATVVSTTLEGPLDTLHV